MNTFEYFSEVEERFTARRGSALLLSTLDWALIETWRDAGVPLAAVLRGIDDAFDKYDAKAARGKGKLRKVNGLAWCAQAVMEAAEQMAEAAVGSGPVAPAEAGAARETRETGFEGERVARFLAANATAIGAAPVPIGAMEAREETARRLRELATGASDAALDELDRTLTVLEEKLVAALNAAAPEATLVGLRAEADAALLAFRGKMGTVQLRQVREQFMTRKLLAEYQVPRLSLFYMGLGDVSGELQVRIGPVLRRGNGLAVDGSCVVPFTLPGELAEVAQDVGEATLLQVIEASPERVKPGCPHFGVCGGCQLQMASADEQLRMKQAVLLDWMERAVVRELPEVQVHSAEPWGYRNRVRLRVGRDEAGALRLGYNQRASRQFLPVRVCPISAPLLWRAAEALLAACERSAELRVWLEATVEVELFADDTLEGLQVLFLQEGKAPDKALGRSGVKAELTFVLAMEALRIAVPELAGAGAVLLGPAARGRESSRERTRTPVAAWGAAGLAYEVSGERYWISRGGFFQVNRFLLPDLVRLVCEGRSGSMAWDLFAGVGLFSRVLARSFERVTAVEGSPVAARDLGGALGKMGKWHRAVQASAVEFLQAAVVQRERPELLTLDPPRAGAGEAACELLLRVGAAEMVYVSCDPETLARDMAVLQRGYRVTALHLVDMFPQTYHQETVMVLERRG